MTEKLYLMQLQKVRQELVVLNMDQLTLCFYWLQTTATKKNTFYSRILHVIYKNLPENQSVDYSIKIQKKQSLSQIILNYITQKA